MIDFARYLRLIWCMNSAAHALGTSVFALRQAFPNGIPEDIKLAFAFLLFGGVVLWDAWPRLRRWFGWLSLGVAGRPRLRYEEHGRSGEIHFDNGRSRFRMYWEFGGGQTVVIIDVPSPAEWVSQTGLPIGERETVLQFVAQQVICDKMSNPRYRYEIGPDTIRILEPSAA